MIRFLDYGRQRISQEVLLNTLRLFHGHAAPLSVLLAGAVFALLATGAARAANDAAATAPITDSTAAGATAVPWNDYISPTDLAALSPTQKEGLRIAIMDDLRNTGWGDSESDMKMVVRNKHGKESPREVLFRNLEVPNDGDKSLSIFRSPRDLDGTAFLSYSHIEGADEQWVYLASLKRVKRINSSNKSGPYMGSEFSYEDLASFEVAKYDYNYLRDEVYDGMDCYVVERFPRDSNSGYTRIVAWIDKAHYRRMKVEFYDRKKTHLKTLVRSNYGLFLENFWRAQLLTMTNHQTGKSTTLQFDNLRFGNGFTDRDFDKNTLARSR